MKGEIRILDSFAGIGGLRMGFEKAAMEMGLETRCVSAIEFDKDARNTYVDNFGHEPEYGDITCIDDMSVMPDHDVLLAGFPCQTFSRNGKYYNKNNRTLGDDERKNLVTYLFEILNTKKPKMFLFENVKEILSIKNSDGSLFFDTMSDNVAMLGYKMLYAVLDARDYGLPQQRRRVYMVGFRDDLDLHERFSFPESSGSSGCIRDILEDDVDDKYLIEKLWKNRKNIRLPGMRMDALRLAYKDKRWEENRSVREPVGKILPVAIVYGDTPSGLPRQQDKLYSMWGVSPTIATFSTPAIDVDGVWRLLTPRECARLQGFPDDFILPGNDTLAYRQIGNSVPHNVVVAIAKKIMEVCK